MLIIGLTRAEPERAADARLPRAVVAAAARPPLGVDAAEAGPPQAR